MATGDGTSRSGAGLFGAMGVGVAAGAAAAAGVLFGRKVAATAEVGAGHPLEHRVLDAAAAAMQLWHSHHYEVRSGALVAPGIPDMAEHAYFEDLVTTYGKTFHTWQYDRDDFPYGAPQLMMALTDDGQADEALIHERDRRLGVSTSHKRRNRGDIPMPDVASGANSWESGRTVQTRLKEMDVGR